MTDRADVPPEVLAALRSICAGLPESYEEPAWVGTRWRIRHRTVLHVFTAHPGSTGAFSRAAELTEPAVVMTFRAQAEELDSLVGAGPPFFRAAWGTDVVGMIIDADADWSEIRELLTESYRKLAPAKLARLLP